MVNGPLTYVMVYTYVEGMLKVTLIHRLGATEGVSTNRPRAVTATMARFSRTVWLLVLRITRRVCFW